MYYSITRIVVRGARPDSAVISAHWFQQGLAGNDGTGARCSRLPAMSQIPTRRNLLADSVTPTLLPDDGVDHDLSTDDAARHAAVAHPASSLAWAVLAESALRATTTEGDVAAYAYARTGYHRGLDALRRNGWRGSGPVPWEHVPNRGFLRALWALAVAADRIGDTEEASRCAQFLRDSSETAYQKVAG